MATFLTEPQGPVPARFNTPYATLADTVIVSRNGYTDWRDTFQANVQQGSSGFHGSFTLEARTTKDGARALFKRIFSMVNGGNMPPQAWAVPDAEGVSVENFSMATLMSGTVTVRM